MKLRFTGQGPDRGAIRLAAEGLLEAGTVVVVGDERGRVLRSAYPGCFELVTDKPKRSRARSKPPADRSMRGPTGEG